MGVLCSSLGKNKQLNNGRTNSYLNKKFCTFSKNIYLGLCVCFINNAKQFNSVLTASFLYESKRLLFRFVNCKQCPMDCSFHSVS